jgi:hypothetical protein
VEHFNPHQFDVAICGRCEIMVHDVSTMLNLHLDWVVLKVDVHNAFNLVSWLAIFQELQFLFGFLNQFFPFVGRFYTHSSPLYFPQVS